MISSEDRHPSLARGHRFEKLAYRVVDCSSFSPNYRPEAILEDNPTEQASRWSSAANDQHQYITLRLDQPALISTITFGKFHKNHVCNLREFKVFVKTGHDCRQCEWIETLHSGLRNDSEPETFPLVYPLWDYREEVNGAIPVQWVKIVPLASWGNNFNYSIWYVELRGTAEDTAVEPVAQRFSETCQRESWRLCLKFLREQAGMEEVFRSLQSQTGVKLEDPLVSQLWDVIINQGAYAVAESLITSALEGDAELFQEYIGNKVEYTPVWTRLDRCINSNGEITTQASPGNWPSVRGGHQMSFDPREKMIYLLGGWDGHRDLGDFWRYDIGSGIWTCLSDDTRREGGPGARSCHKVALYTTLRRLYVLGRYIDTESRASATAITSDFYYYDLERHTWTCVAPDVTVMGGPPLLYDHQMAVDEEEGVIYVFGGRIIVLPQTPNVETLYSGLYSFNIKTEKWRLIRSDSEVLPSTPNIKSRIGHSMQFNPETRKLYIFAGQRHKDYLCDFYVYDVDTDTVDEMFKDTSKLGGPDPGLTQRATLDAHRRELFLFSGIVKEKHSAATPLNAIPASASLETPRNHFWIYRLDRRCWLRVFSDGAVGGEQAVVEPVPRFAHQLVYDAEGAVHYLFGGNPGESGNPRRRLNDLWSLQLVKKQSSADILRRIIFLIRRQQFLEMCRSRVSGEVASPTMITAMRFLQQEVSHAVHHHNEDESREFRALSAWLLKVPPELRDVRACRLSLFYDIVSFLPVAMQPPRSSIIDNLQFGKFD